MMEGVQRSQYDTLVKSVFHRVHFASDELVEAIERKFQDRKWKKGVLRTLRGTVGHSVGPAAEQVAAPDPGHLGRERPASSPTSPARSARPTRSLKVRQVVIPKCGHAPQIEKARLVNQLVLRFLRDKLKTIPPALDPARFLARAGAAPAAQGHAARPLSRDSDASAIASAPPRRLSTDERLLPVPRQVPQARHGDRQPRPEQPLALADDRPQHRLGPRQGRSSSWARGPARSPGSWPSRRRPDCRVIVLERDPDFARLLRERFADLPNFDVVEGDVRDLAEILGERGIDQVDYVDLRACPSRRSPRTSSATSSASSSRCSPPAGRSTRSPRCPGSTGGSTAGSSTTSSSPSSRGTSRRPGPTSAGA